IESSQYQIRTEGVRRDGSRFPLLCTVSRYSANRGGSYIVILRDLTETYRREEEQITAAREREALRGQQMAMLAQLATGVAHEIRNPLTSIKMLIQVNRAMFADKGLPTEDLDLVEQEIRRMERSVNGLLDYGRPTKGETKLFTLQDAVDRTLRLIEGRCEKQGIEVTLDFPTDPLQVMGDPSEIRQLLLNLVLNALDAMPDGGTLSLKARPDNEVINISVADTGPGIDHDVMEQLFSPFVTSKPNGTGLGLCICRRIAESHHGSLTAHNLSEQGACLELILPNPATTNKTNHADANTSGH
ncbi:MAG: ATP-binding protein, partial [Pirellulales bacterium]